MQLSLQYHFLSPVESVKVTSQNLEDVAKWCGGKVAQTESRRVPGRMDSYVWVPTPKDTKLSWAFPGMIITKRLVVTVKGELRSTWAVFRRDYFDKNYFETPQDAVDQTWEREKSERENPKSQRPEVVVNVSVGDAMGEAFEKVQAEVARIAEEHGISNVTVNHYAEASESEQVEGPADESEKKPETALEDAITG